MKKRVNLIDIFSAEVERIAIAAHNVNRAYRESIGDEELRSWDDTDDERKDCVRKGVATILVNPDITEEGQHENWLKEMKAKGWCYGEEENPVIKTHPCMVPYDELPRAQQFKDTLFGLTVRALAGAL